MCRRSIPALSSTLFCGYFAVEHVGATYRLPTAIGTLFITNSGNAAHDSKPALELFAGIDLAGKKVLADKAYSCDKERGAEVCIPDKANFRMKHAFDAELYKQRNKSRALFSTNQELSTRCFSFRQISSLF